MNGELSFGGVDNTKIIGDVKYASISELILCIHQWDSEGTDYERPPASTKPANEFWGIDQTVTYGSGNTILSSAAGIVDTGTTLILLATDAFQEYQKLTGGVLDENTGLLRITVEQYANIQSLFFNIAGVC